MGWLGLDLSDGIGTNGELLCVRLWTLRFRKMQVISWLGEEMLASQEGLSCRVVISTEVFLVILSCMNIQVFWGVTLCCWVFDVSEARSAYSLSSSSQRIAWLWHEGTTIILNVLEVPNNSGSHPRRPQISRFHFIDCSYTSEGSRFVFESDLSLL